MKVILSFLALIVVAGLGGMIVFLNQQKVSLVLTPPFRGIYYTLPEMPFGLVVVLALLTGILIGYILSLLSKLLR
ncbi:MAG: hypothetical protein N3C57_02615 [Aquificaceae bacterium]|nr:hypothetical protein [Aquificaceae bacterium]MCX8075904.1 hypothetical protein [Aquificaceae bacterium]MDW8095450.1 hypothetical protein [Aquificaceae bacterium]MDW8433754.1 hypothetical protein [Aquificaceae bacterium]